MNVLSIYLSLYYQIFNGEFINQSLNEEFKLFKYSHSWVLNNGIQFNIRSDFDDQNLNNRV